MLDGDINFLYKQLENANMNEFENIFSAIMQKIYGSNYKQTQTYGNKGDRGLDGILLNKDGDFGYAIYAPEKYSDKKAIEKIKSDYNKFKNQQSKGNWENIVILFFVIKASRAGITSDVLNTVSALNKNNRNVKFGILDMRDIKNEIENYIPTQIPICIMNDIYSNIKNIKEKYECLEHLFNDHFEGNTNNLLHIGNENYADEIYNMLREINNHTYNLKKISDKYNLSLKKLGLENYFEDIINLKAYASNERMTTVIYGFEDILNNDNQQKRINACKNIINFISKELNKY